MIELKQEPMSEDINSQKKKRQNPKKKLAPSDLSFKMEKNLDVDQLLDSKMEIHTDIIEYINRLEFLVLKNRQKLMSERKLFTQILTNIANYFDHKGISAMALDEYINSISGQIQSDIEIENSMKNFYKFLDQPTKQAPIAQQIQKDGQMPPKNKKLNAPQNLIKLQLNENNVAMSNLKQEEHKSDTKKKKRRQKIEVPTLSAQTKQSSFQEPKLKKKKKPNPDGQQHSQTQSVFQPIKPQASIQKKMYNSSIPQHNNKAHQQQNNFIQQGMSQLNNLNQLQTPQIDAQTLQCLANMDTSQMTQEELQLLFLISNTYNLQQDQQTK